MVISMSLKDLLPTVEQVSTLPSSDAMEARRRPGRVKTVSPDLVPLLRSPATTGIREPSSGKAGARLIENDLGTVKGIIFALVLSVPLWAAISAGVWMVIR